MKIDKERKNRILFYIEDMKSNLDTQKKIYKIQKEKKAVYQMSRTKIMIVKAKLDYENAKKLLRSLTK